MNYDQLAANTGAPLGAVNRAGQVTVTWNMQGWQLAAPADPSTGDPRCWLPCESCGRLVAVANSAISCDSCSKLDCCATPN